LKDAKYRVALIGGGRAGPARARAFDAHPLCTLVAVADTDPENLELTARRFGATPYDTYHDMLAREQLDIVLPILPVRPNADAVVAAAEAGVKAIFCEKPLTASLADADRMVEACSSRGIPLGAGVMVSSHPDYRQAYRLAGDGTIGELHRINLYGRNNQGGCHGMNLTRKFAQNSPVEEIIGRVSGDPFSDHEEPYDEAETGFGDLGGYIRFANGVEAFLGLGDHGVRGIEVVGTRGMIVNGDNTSLGLQLRQAPEATDRVSLAAMEPVDVGFSPLPSAPRGYDEAGWQDPGVSMREIVEDFIRVLEEGGELEITTGDDLRHALEMSIAVRESHRRGHAPVTLPLEDRSLAMYPERSRWHYKKTIYGRERYMEMMAAQKKDD
jgi:predicted dehydrogenase